MNLNRQLADFYISEGLIEPELASRIVSDADTKSTSLYKELIATKSLDEITVYEFLAKFFNIPYFTVSVFTIDDEILKLLPMLFIKDNRLVPVGRENDKLVVLTDEPYRVVDAVNLVYFIQEDYVVKLITPSSMNTLLGYIDNRRRRVDAMRDINNEFKPEKDGDLDASQLIDAPTVKLTDSILREATAMGASDIHIEPFDEIVRVRFRVDGQLYTNTELSKASYPAVLARFKIMANMDISERRIPQDGKITMEIGGRKYDYRVSTLPMIFGEKIAIRVYDTTDDLSDISKLGLDPAQEKRIRRMISYPHGILLLTGPTGSGKTTSLYSFLKSLNVPNVNITTIEDPVENNIKGINQVQINPKVNLTFASTLRSILRQDPNIIMIGEIRDEETAEIAVKAAITGHLVLSSLHTNNAHGTVSRLIDMGIPPYLVADALIGAISQRLVRKLCPDCRKPHVTTKEEMIEFGLNEPATIYEPCGCPSCNNTGYRSRTGVFEIMNMSSEIKNAIEGNNFTMEKVYRAAVNSGMIPLKEAAKKLVLDGVTSFSEYMKLVDSDTDLD